MRGDKTRFRKRSFRTAGGQKVPGAGLFAVRFIQMRRLFVLLLCLVLLLPAGGPEAGSGFVYAGQASRSAWKDTQTKTKKSEASQKSAAKLNRTAVELKSGMKTRLRVSGTNGEVRWSVRNRKIVKLKRTGKRSVTIGAARAGTTTVTARVGKKRLKCTVTVTDVSVSALDEVVSWTQVWRNGSWDEDGYHDASGNLLADMNLALTYEGSAVKKSARYPILYIGASRTKNTADAVKDKKVFFYCCGGAGFRWFFNPTFHYGRRIEPAFQVIRTYLSKRPSGTVIIDLGGNDMSNIEAYVGFYRQLLTLYPQAKFWFIGILPRARSNPSNRRRKAFNERLKTEFPDHTIDLFDWVYGFPDFKTIDGIHFEKKLSRRIYKKIMEKIGRKIRIVGKKGKVR